MPIRSMTGFAQVKGQLNAGTAFTLSLKSVNHRFLDLHFRAPAAGDAVEMKLRRLLKEKVARGHIELTVGLEHGESGAIQLNRPLVEGYIKAFRAAAADFGIAAEPDLNAVLRLPGAMDAAEAEDDQAAEAALMDAAEEALARLNAMREEEGRGLERELRERMAHLSQAAQTVEQHRQAVVKAYFTKIESRMQELLNGQGDPERILQEAALLADRSDIHEELVRLHNHVAHFLGLLDQGGEVGKKLDFLLQEMNREANTLLSKTSGLAGEALKITEMGLAMKSEIEKSREQVQNVE
jgi:uncharacterized protein (TIGR00255 family)